VTVLTVVSDTSPILYLLLIDQIDLLPRLYQTITIPGVVQIEMQAKGAPTALQSWITHPPDWLEITPHLEADYTQQPQLPQLRRLQAGEQAAIALALSLQADLLIVDDLDARRTAQDLGLSIVGMLGILGEAAKRDWIDFPNVLNRLLQETNFRLSPQLARDLLKEFSS
jgi:predicted nucleic acid-binding protein